MAITLDTPVVAVLGADTGKKAERLAGRLGIRTVDDLLHHFPRRYLRTGELTRLGELRPHQPVVTVGRIASRARKSYPDRRTGRTAYRVEAVVETGGPRLHLTYFAKHLRQVEWREESLPEGARGVFVGKATRFGSTWQLAHPDFVLFGAQHEDAAGAAAVAALGDLFPLYPTTGTVRSWEIQRAVAFALSLLDRPEDHPDVLPDRVRAAYGLPGTLDALRGVHQPQDPDQVSAGQRRFRFEEALVNQLVLLRRRAALRAAGTRARTGGGGLREAFDARLPFTLTDGQRRVGREIDDDLARDAPMNRLLQGEVGSGKTLVALRAMLRVVDSGGQAVLLAPTEVLAQQHHRSLTAMLGDLARTGLRSGLLGGDGEGTDVSLLTGSMSTAQRRESLLRIASGEAGLVIGTHALLEDRVSFADLGLVVVDEQHRFGVEQRAALTDKAGAPPHVLVMTATPIPRTVAMTVFGDLEVSTLDELPAGRAPISTTVVPLAEQPHWEARIWERVREEVAAGRQAYVVCPRIGADDAGGEGVPDRVGGPDEPDEAEGSDGAEDAPPPAPAAAVEAVVATLAAGPLAGLRVAPLHGRLAADDKDATMRAFAAGEVDVLVATTVIEVGVDVGNATAMVILDADRFGVSQLHQLRGRVGRGGHPGLCLLVTRTADEAGARERLEAVAATLDGFELARVDLEQRREGDVLGARQSGGRSSLVTLKVLRDEDTIVEARGAALELLEDDPDLDDAPLLREAVAALEASVRADFLEKS